ncbi:MAG: glycosyltransferase [Deltaproteobacteria bacterium]|nr:glycosyltransferase [Deltaproteobacteria bacterium]
MTKTAAIVGLSFAGITNSVCSAFRTLGWDVQPFLYDPPPRNVVLRQWDKLTDTNGSHLGHSFNTVLRDEVIPSVRQRKPDLLLVLKGEKLEEDTMEQLQGLQVPLLSWVYDSLERCPGQMDIAQIARHAFCIDGADAERMGVHGTWLPVGYDDAIYWPRCRFEEKDFDILFTGTIAGALTNDYTVRRECLLELSASGLADRYHCGFIGTTGTHLGDFRLRKQLLIPCIASYLSPDALAGYLSRAKVCINVHQDDGGKPVNPMFFAIPGAGTCQVAEARPYLATWLEPEREYVPFDSGCLVERLEQLLADQPTLREICDAGQRAASSSHTFVQRIAFMIGYL